MTGTLELRGFIIGAQKGGSTSLDRYVARHPGVWASHDEAPYFESPDFERDGLSQLRKLLTRPGGGDRVAVLRRPNYLCLPEVPDRLAAAYPALRLMLVLRDPIDRSISAYFHYMRYGLAPVLALNEGLRALLEDDVDLERWPRAQEILAFSDYGTAMTRWRDHFSDEQILVMSSQDLRQRPREVFALVADHLGIGVVEPPEPANRDSMRGIYDMRLVVARSRVTPLLYRKSAEGRLRARGPLPKVWDRMESLVGGSRTRPALSPKLLAKMRARYAPEMARLRAEMGPNTPGFVDSYV